MTISSLSKKCPIAELNAEELTDIPPAWEVEVTPNTYHAKNLTLFLLAQNDLTDPFTKKPLTISQLQSLTSKMGISVSAFVEIWTEASNRSLEEFKVEQMNLETPDLELSLIDYFTNIHDFCLISRIKNLNEILHNEAAFSSNPNDLKKRYAFLTMLKTCSLWNAKILESYSPVKKLSAL